jgi:Cu/Ag efflux protein CusF
MFRRFMLSAGLALGATVVLAVALAAAPSVALAQAAAPQVAGEITKLDRAQGRLTLKHGEIKNLDMPPMTMVFRVKEAKMLDGLAVGDRVRFSAAKIDGHYMVTSIAKAP